MEPRPEMFYGLWFKYIIQDSGISIQALINYAIDQSVFNLTTKLPTNVYGVYSKTDQGCGVEKN